MSCRQVLTQDQEPLRPAPPTPFPRLGPAPLSVRPDSLCFWTHPPACHAPPWRRALRPSRLGQCALLPKPRQAHSPCPAGWSPAPILGYSDPPTPGSPCTSSGLHTRAPKSVSPPMNPVHPHPKPTGPYSLTPSSLPSHVLAASFWSLYVVTPELTGLVSGAFAGAPGEPEPFRPSRSQHGDCLPNVEHPGPRVCTPPHPHI